MALGENVHSLPERRRGRAVGRGAPGTPPRSGPSPFDNLLELATEIEQQRDEPVGRTDRERGRAGSTTSAPAVPIRVVQAPPPPIARPIPRTERLTVPVVQRLLLASASALLVLVVVLLVWGADLERLARPGVQPASSSGGDAAEVVPDPAPPGPAGAPAAPEPSTGASAPATQDTAAPTTVEVPVTPEPGVLPAGVACDTTSVAPLVEPLNAISPVRIASVTCLGTYGAVVVVPADGAAEPESTIVVSIKAADAGWIPLHVGNAAECGPASQAVDPAFPATLC